MSRQKKYKMKAISAAISEKGGHSAQSVPDEHSIAATLDYNDDPE